jgi:hypothetical protein
VPRAKLSARIHDLSRRQARTVVPVRDDQPRVDVDEVAGLRTIEQGEQLVGGEFLQCHCRTVRARFGGPDPCIDAKIDLGEFASVGDGEAGEAVTAPFAANVHSGLDERCLDGVGERVDVVG